MGEAGSLTDVVACPSALSSPTGRSLPTPASNTNTAPVAGSCTSVLGHANSVGPPPRWPVRRSVSPSAETRIKNGSVLFSTHAAPSAAGIRSPM